MIPPLTQLSMIRRRNGHRFVDDPETGCWLWLGPFLPNGYPTGGSTSPQRRFYRQFHAGIPDGHDVHHLCRNRECVNPEHLEARPSREHRVEHWLERSGLLTLDKVREIRQLAADRTLSAPEVARRYGVHHNTVYRIMAGERWPEAGPVPAPVCALPGCDVELPALPRHRKYCHPDHANAAFRLRQRERQAA